MVLTIFGGSALNARVARSTGVGSSRLVVYALTIVMQWLLVGFTWFGLRLRNIRLRDLVGDNTAHWKTIVRDIAIAITFLVVANIVIGALQSMLHTYPTRALLHLVPRRRIEVAVWLLVAVTAGITEEILFRGYLLNQFRAMTTSTRTGLLMQAFVFGAAHGYQGSVSNWPKLTDMVVLREATADDADAIGRVHVDAWRAGYRGMMPDAFLDSLDAAARAARWRDVLTRRERDKRIIVALDDDALVGFAGVGPARDEASERGELYMINIAPSVWSKGIGTSLLAEAVRALALFGHRDAILWVLDQNARARRFYEREGWSHDGRRTDAISENGFTFQIAELRYARTLSR